MNLLTKYAIDKEKGLCHIVHGVAFNPDDFALCGVNVLRMCLNPVPVEGMKPCDACLMKKSSIEKDVLMSHAPTAAERLQSTEEVLMARLFKSWANRIDREVEILKLQQVDKSKLEGLCDLQEEIEEACRSMENAWLIAKFGSINDK
jgi:hypothetical protein